jgi:hypothetical protein
MPSEGNVPRKTRFLLYLKKTDKKLVQQSFILIYSPRMSITQDRNKLSVKVQPAESWRNKLRTHRMEGYFCRSAGLDPARTAKVRRPRI